MTRPVHEQALEVRFNGGNTCLTSEGHGIVAYGKLEWLQFFAAAPDMARRLEGLLRGFHQGYRLTPADAQGIEQDLRKAGVI